MLINTIKQQKLSFFILSKLNFNLPRLINLMDHYHTHTHTKIEMQSIMNLIILKCLLKEFSLPISAIINKEYFIIIVIITKIDKNGKFF